MALRSVLWDYFSRINKELASCNACDREIPTKYSNTTALANHLKHNHFTEWQEMQEKKLEDYCASDQQQPCASSAPPAPPTGSDSLRQDSQQDPPVMAPSFGSEMAEVSSLLSLAMPMANVNFLVDEGGKDDPVAIEVRPRERLFKAYRAPPAKWSVIMFWLPSGAISVYILKMDRQIIESKEFQPNQTLEAVEFVKSHAFINNKWRLCPGASDVVATSGKSCEDTDRSRKCELLVPAEDGMERPAQCNFCERSADHIKEEVCFVDKGRSGDYDRKVKQEDAEFDHEVESAGEGHKYYLDDDNFRSEGALGHGDVNSLTAGMKLRREALWKYFTERDDNNAACNACGKELRARKTGSTANLIRHLMHFHNALYVEFKSSKMNIEAESKDMDSDGLAGVLKKNKRSVIWDYYTKTESGTVRCNTCRKELRTHGSTSNLQKHLLHKHKSVHFEYKERRLQELRRGSSHNKLPEELNHHFFDDGTSEYGNYQDISEDFDDDMYAEEYPNPSNYLQEESMYYEGDSGYLDPPSIPRNSGAESKIKRKNKNSIIWEYYTKKDELTVVCNSCQREMKYHGNNTTLIRHLMRKHKSAHAEYTQKKLEELDQQELKMEMLQDSDEKLELKQEFASGIQDDSKTESLEDGFQQGALEPGLKVESQENNNGEHVETQQGPGNGEEIEGSLPKEEEGGTVGVGLGGRKKSVIWEYFVRIDKFTVTCNTCKNEVRANDTTTCLRNHLRHNHKAIHAEYKERRLRELRQHFQERRRHFGSSGLKEEENGEAAPGIGERRNPGSRSVVWQYFGRKDRDTVTCNMCQKDFTSHQKASGSLQRHLMRAHKEAYAEYRGKRLSQLEDATTRLSKWDERFKSDEFKCEPCRTTFSSEKRWAIHMQRHKGEPDVDVPEIPVKVRQYKRFVCHLCGAVMCLDSKVRHMAVTHEVFLGTKYTCETCGKVYWTKSEFHRHVKSHTGEASYVCSFCGKHFTSLHGRRYCEERCQGNLKFECSTCGKKFLVKQRLVCHERIHTGERPFACPLPRCNSAYMSKTNLATHVKQTHKRELRDVLAEKKEMKEATEIE